jgi:hypothetical protein
MRSVAAWLLLNFAFGCAFGASIASPDSTAPLTLVFQFDGNPSEKSFLEMKHELGSILKGSGIQVEWRDRHYVGSSEWFANLVVVKFRGVCKMDAGVDRDTGSGPLAFTYLSDGAILPFSEVECDRVRSSLRNVMSRHDYLHSEAVFGRAMARVLAHELYHVLAGTAFHSATGVAQRALSGSELVSGQLELNPEDLDLMRR